MTREEQNELYAAYDKAVWDIARLSLHTHTVQFFNRTASVSSKYKPAGSGVLVFAAERYFIFTASHVTGDWANDPLYTNTQNGVQQVQGEWYLTNLEMDHTMDLSWIELDEDFAFLLSRSYTFLPVEKILYGYQPKGKIGYMASGYPERNIWVDAVTGKVTTGSSHFLMRMANEKAYEFYRYKRENNYLLEFSGTGTDLDTGEQLFKLEDPYGISGCGLWVLPHEIIDGEIVIDYFLIGIMFRVIKGKYHVLIGNRIELIMQALAEIANLPIRPLSP